ncbi:MAG TPA: MlaE family lipid ABC transporter permease subunit [Kiloniellales bacterium]|nr:MlaE family lipid ABC transporter permease subunit [Kiloniellales bacterium]
MAGLSEGTAAAEPRLELSRDGDRLVLVASGDWRTRRLQVLERRLKNLKLGRERRALIDLSGIEHLDTAGAWLLERTRRALEAAGYEVETSGLAAEHERLLQTVIEHERETAPPRRRPRLLVEFVNNIGRAVFDLGSGGKALVNFLGITVIVLARSALQPWRIRWRAVVAHMQSSGVSALPIVGLVSFLIGIVLAYQGAEQLRRFGAQVFTVDIVGIGVLREMAILLTAIIVAGRSGSAYTAQIGAMQVNEEIDALKTLGLDPMEILVMPRLIGLILVLPLLAFYADVMGLLGGAVLTMLVLDLSISQFVVQLRGAVDVWDLGVGLIKAPLFAFIIAMVGCFEGFRVERSAESVGQATTRSVVEGVFLVIVLDAMLSVFFQVIGV